MSTTKNNSNTLPDSGFVREKQIIGSKKEGIPAVVPISHSTWWAGVKTGRYPKPIKLSPKVTVWRVADIKELINAAGGAE